MDTNAILLNLSGKLPKDSIALGILKEKLDKLSDKQRDEFYQKVIMARLKSPSLIFWVGSFLFGSLGVGRFMVGDILLGIIRLALSIVFIVLTLVDKTNLENYNFMLTSSDASVGGMLLWAIKAWWFIDLFLVGKRARDLNMKKCLELL
ncbi:hypothetical protein BKH43_05020 [Helicobacter sp. 13S00401-1]|uniref:NINE protein n=1 Tax=Helicobacter sp. 13S00401-1 TaxID=1905758 RepID=UPI000BA75D16|nr:NINE protein [Helicobacter sp. 13S00401-1]PAF50265.1 hypothetical protein BKH43_05020 [Helicobacter sp. 13S00401-1]